jgi:DNA helicase HerA-like ATPase
MGLEGGSVPVEFVSLTGKLGVQLRATVSDFGPLLLSKVLGLNDTQASVLTLLVKYCDDNQLPLLDFEDLRAVLQFLTSDAGKGALAGYGGMSEATVGVLLRKMIELEAQGAQAFFGEPQFDVHDLLAKTSDGRGVVTCLELADAQDKPRLFSTFMMWLLADLYHNLPEAGDLDRPKLVFFFDEAHLLFPGCPQALPRAGRTGGAAGSLERRRRVLRHPDPEGRTAGRPGPTEQPGAARSPGPHPG